MTIAVKGLDALQRRLRMRGLEEDIYMCLSLEAATIAEEATATAPGRLGETIEIMDESAGPRAAFAIGTAHRAGRFVEFGTRNMRPQPFLWPVSRARLPRIKHALTESLRARLAKR